MAKKTLKFQLGKTLSLDNNQEVMCEIIQCGKDKFTLKNYAPIPFAHDDSIAYTGVLCCGDTPICSCHGDGWGGQTDLTPLHDWYKSLDEEVRHYKWSYDKTEFELTLDFIADTLACTAELKHKK